MSTKPFEISNCLDARPLTLSLFQIPPPPKSTGTGTIPKIRSSGQSNLISHHAKFTHVATKSIQDPPQTARNHLAPQSLPAFIPIRVHLWFPRISNRQLLQARIAVTLRKQTTAANSNRQLFLLFFFAFLPCSCPTFPTSNSFVSSASSAPFASCPSHPFGVCYSPCNHSLRRGAA
jgi:hypothetical protein